MSKRMIVTFVGVLAMVALAAAPARGTAPPALFGMATGTSGTHTVRAECAAVVGATTDLNEITYAVVGSAQSATTDAHAVGVGTGVTCEIVDKLTGASYGSVSGGLPGPTGAAAGTIAVPINSSPKMCASGNAVFSDDHTASADDC